METFAHSDCALNSVVASLSMGAEYVCQILGADTFCRYSQYTALMEGGHKAKARTLFHIGNYFDEIFNNFIVQAWLLFFG